MAAGDATTTQQRKASLLAALPAALSNSPQRRSSTSPMPRIRSASPAATSAASSPSPRVRADDVWRKWEHDGAIQAGLLHLSQLDDFLADLNLEDTPDLKRSLEEEAEQGSEGLTLEQISSICSGLDPRSPATSSSGSPEGQASNAPLKQCLSKNKAYQGTGYLVYDETVVTYIRRLEEHRRKCESDGRYKEAKAAASRLVDLKTAQVARMRHELMLVQTQELGEVQRVYEEETGKFNGVWEARIKDYQQNFVRAVDEMRAQHQQQGEQLAEERAAKRPTKPKPSRDYLNNKRIEASLAKVKEYKRASQVKSVTEEMYASELNQALQAFDADYRLKVAKLVARQRTEMEALVQRGVRGKSELDLRRATETERRMFRFRNIVMELESLHKLEVVSLENFLDGQVQAGKATPLEDGFRRKREQLFCSQF